MSSNSPRVSIGLPVYNGERYLSHAIDSLLAQTFTDFELIISDNASSDRTEEICRSHAANDERVHYFRNEQNIGAIPNLNRTFELATGQYFMGAAHDDMWAPTFVARCVAVLDTRPDVVLAYARATIIDEDGHPVSADEEPVFRTDVSSPHVRFHDLVRTPHRCFQIFGIMRASAMAKAPPRGTYTSSDIVLLAELGLMGPFHEVPETLMFYRHHSQQSIKLDRHARMAWSGSAVSTFVTFPHWRLFFELWSCIARGPLPWSERIRCYFTMLRWLFWYPNPRRMGKDVVRASCYLLGSWKHLARGPKLLERPDHASV